MEASKARVVITGITGFLGSHVCKAFLDHGSFIVRGTVRDLSNARKLDPLREAFGEKFNELELVEADLLKPESLDQAIEGQKYVIHTASPLPAGNVKNEDLVVKPAVEGTMSVLKACLKHQVKRAVVTSSSLAIMGFGAIQEEPFTEQNWSDPNIGGAYPKSKVLAEKAAWEFVYGLPEEEKFELVTVNPALIMGPNLIYGDFGSGKILSMLMTGKIPGLPRMMTPIVDVRDCAQTHLKAILVPEAANKRIISCGSNLWFRDIAEILHKEFGEDYSIRRGEFKYCTVKLVSVFVSQVRLLLPVWDKEVILNNERSIQVLGQQYTDPQTTFKDMVEALIKYGQLPEKRKAKLTTK